MKRSLVLISGVIALSLSTYATAGTLKLNPSGPPGSAYGVNSNIGFVGLIPATYTAGAISKSFYMYCIDRELHSYWNASYDTSTSQMFGPIPGESGQIAFIANKYNSDLATPPFSVSDAASAQLAVWIIRANGNSSWFSSTGLASSYLTRANQIISESLTPSAEDYLATRLTTTDTNVQDFVTGGETFYNSNQVVPEPFTMALGASCIALALRRRKKS